MRESSERTRAAIRNSGLNFPGNQRITVNLAPADLRKEGPYYDLPIAVGVLAATQQVWPNKLEDAFFMAKLSLEGTRRHTKGILSLAALARREGVSRVFVPAVDAAEAALMPDIEVIPVASLADLAGHLKRGVSPEQAVERLDEVDEPRDPWKLRLTIPTAGRSGDVVATANAHQGKGGWSTESTSISHQPTAAEKPKPRSARAQRDD